MAEYIEREAAMDIVKRTSGDYAAVWAEIRKLPTENVVPVVHGQWVLESDDNQDEGHYYCSICKSAEYFADFVPFSKFCSNCGARMQEAQ